MRFHTFVVGRGTGDWRTMSMAVVCLLFAVMLTFSALASPHLPKPETAHTDGWSIYAVHPSGRIRIDVSLALDSHDLPHISYYDEVYQDQLDGDLMYARWVGSNWSIETVDSEGDVGAHNSLALDSHDFPQIAYFDNVNYDLNYARWDGSAWNIETVDSAGYVGKYTSIAVDSRDYPHISYQAQIQVGGVAQHYDLRHAWWNGSSWNVGTVDTYVQHDSSMALDSHDFPHMSYFSAVDKNLKYARWTGSTWSIETVDSLRLVGHLSSIALDSHDFPHIGYSDGANDDLRYARWNGSAWNIETVDSVGYVGRQVSIALDSQDHPRMSYLGADSGLKYARWNGTAWTLEIVDTIDAVGDSTSIAVDSKRYPHIAYNTWSRNLKYATKASLLKPHVSLDIDPDTLNLKSKGRWITAYLTTENAKAEDIDPSSLLLNDAIPPVWWDIQSESTLMVKFDRAAVQAILPVSSTVDIKVTGQWKDGEAFEVHDVIRVIDVGGHMESPWSIHSREDIHRISEWNSLFLLLQGNRPTALDLTLRLDQHITGVSAPIREERVYASFVENEGAGNTLKYAYSVPRTLI